MANSVYHAPKCVFEVKDGCILTDRSIIHKVTGTSMAGILGCSPWSTPFQVACALLGVCRADISGKPSVRVGQELEPVVIKYLSETYPDKGLFLSAENIFEKRIGDHDEWESDFQDEVFGGHVDGAVMQDDEEYILEIKTSINADSWVDGVPEYYYWQVALYNEFLTQKDRAYVGLGLVNSNTYRDSTSWVPNERNVMLFEMPIDREDVKEKMEYVREWYNTYIVNGITPAYDPDNEGDVAMYNHLCNLSKDILEIREDVGRLAELTTQLNAAEAELAQISSAAEDLKASIKAYMVAHNLTQLSKVNAKATLSVQTRKYIDRKLMILDGLDPEKYTITSESNIFKFSIME